VTHPGFETLVAYWLGELPAAEAGSLEEHYLGCGQCAERLGALARLAEGIRAAVRGGLVQAVVSAGFLEAMKAQGLRVREYALGPGETVHCTIRAEDDAVASRLRAPLAGVARLDAVQTMDGIETMHLRDVPFDAACGEVVLLPSAAAVRALGTKTVRIQLRAIEASGERVVGEYRLLHAPSG
jgi:hypothetical protein